MKYNICEQIEILIVLLSIPLNKLLTLIGKVGESEEDYIDFKELIHKMLRYDPKLRIKPHEVLQHKFFRNITLNSLV